MLGLDGEQCGFYRTLLEFKPSAKPFLTTSVAAFAFSALQGLVEVCPLDLSEIDIPVFPPLAVLSGSGVKARDQTMVFEADLLAVPVSNVSRDRTTVRFEAFIPFPAYIIEFLSIAALTTS